MRFRTKLFLAVLLPASLLVSVAVAVALHEIRAEAELSVREAFKLAHREVGGILEGLRKELKDDELFRGVRFREIVRSAFESREYEALRQVVDGELDTRKGKVDYVAFVRGEEELWYRRSPLHRCSKVCDHKEEIAWIADRAEALLEVDGVSLLARAMAFEEAGGFILVGRNVGAELATLARSLGVYIGLVVGSRVQYRSQPGWAAEQTLIGEAWFEGERYLGERLQIEGLGEVVFLGSMAAADLRRSRALAAGVVGVGLAVVAAGLVSALIARGTSKPVELLVEATRRVADGDYAAKVDIRGRDEIGRLGAAFNEMIEGLRKRRDIMEKTLSRDVAEELMKGMELGGEQREVTIVFMDIRGFTSGTQGVDPAEVVTMLNDMMDQLTVAISRNGGNVNKYLGDGLMAMFGAPKPLEDHALHAARAGLEMQAELRAWNERRVARGLPSFHTGIGINTGVVVCGQVGSKERLEYTLIGEEVNLASRICGKAAPRQVLATKATVDRLRGRLQTRELEPVQVKGISYPVKIFEVTG